MTSRTLFCHVMFGVTKWKIIACISALHFIRFLTLFTLNIYLRFKMRLITVLILYIVFSYGDDCRGLCECSGSVVTCRYLLRFPRFDNEGIITDLTLRFSDVSGAPDFSRSFPRLQTLTLRQCLHVTCELLQRISEERPGVLVNHDLTCLRATTPATTTTTARSTTTALQVFSEGM